MIIDYPIDQDIAIPAQGTWPVSVHLFKRATVAALRAAEATGRPLLVRGLPGVGKSETARAAAAHAQRPFLPVVIDGRTEPDDLKWRVDAVKRLSDAQAQRVRDEHCYVRPELLWWAYDWAGAQQQAHIAQVPPPDVAVPAGWHPGTGRAVVLLDEIDKADPDLPNALLEVLANTGFTPPFAGAPRVACTDQTRPLVVITTNEERELPAAFLRRCLVVTLELPKDPAALGAELIRLATRHERQQRLAQPAPAGPRIAEAVITRAAEVFMDTRSDAQRKGDYLPGTAEFLDLIRALATLYPGQPDQQRQQIELLVGFVRKSLQPPGA
jgi:MoxR-like ATPase